MCKTNTVSPLRQRMIEDMAARKLNPNKQRSYIFSCKRFAAWLKRSPDRATPDEVRGFQLHLIESGTSICKRNRIMTGVQVLVSRHAPPSRRHSPSGSADVVHVRQYGRWGRIAKCAGVVVARGRRPIELTRLDVRRELGHATFTGARAKGL